jgi:hypothetical protein
MHEDAAGGVQFNCSPQNLGADIQACDQPCPQPSSRRRSGCCACRGTAPETAPAARRPLSVNENRNNPRAWAPSGPSVPLTCYISVIKLVDDAEAAIRSSSSGLRSADRRGCRGGRVELMLTIGRSIAQIYHYCGSRGNSDWNRGRPRAVRPVCWRGCIGRLGLSHRRPFECEPVGASRRSRIQNRGLRLGSMREKNDHKNSSPDNEQRTLPCLIFACDSSQLFPVLGSQRSRCHKE